MLNKGRGSVLKRRLRELHLNMEIQKAATKERKLETSDRVVLFDTACNSSNMGDYIIQHYCMKIIEELFHNKEIYAIQTHEQPTSDELVALPGAKVKIVCGTNLITSHVEIYNNWKMPENLYGYSNIHTLGVGWGYYCDDISLESIKLYNTILCKKGFHSVRDSYTQKQFKKMGIDNVLNTSCPTTWKLTVDHCNKIPISKSNRVVATITDYDRDYEADAYMLNMLLNSYDEVAVWIQGIDDMDYLQELVDVNEITVIPRSLNTFTEYLKQNDCDYIGTRLHAGIHALNMGKRSLIVAIDNRAIEIAKDINLPIIYRDRIREELSYQIEIDRLTQIRIPQHEIDLWKSQFIKDEII